MNKFITDKSRYILMKNSLKTSFESDDAEKLDGRKNDQGRRNWGAFALPDYVRSVKPIPTGGGRLYPLQLLLAPSGF